MMLPLDRRQPGIIVEFKKVDTSRRETPEHALERALQQIEEKRYAAELHAAGIEQIFRLAIAFRGKELWVKQNERKL